MWGVVPYIFSVTTGADQSIYINSGTFFFTITGNLNVTTSIHCRKKTFTKSLGGAMAPLAPPLATPLLMPHLSEEKTLGWRKCQLLGSLLDTKEDIQRRKMITISTMKENSHVYQSKYLTLSQKIRHFRVFAECIFLYNCELWTTTKTINDSIDAFHRRQLRYALGIKYPRVITNQQLYDVTKCEPWSIVTERRRLSWLGHMMRLNPETPARHSFKEALRPVLYYSHIYNTTIDLVSRL